MRKKLQAKYMVLETRKDGTKFTNRPLKEAAERLQNLSGQYDDMQKQLVEQVDSLTKPLLTPFGPILTTSSTARKQAKCYMNGCVDCFVDRLSAAFLWGCSYCKATAHQQDAAASTITFLEAESAAESAAGGPMFCEFISSILCIVACHIVLE